MWDLQMLFTENVPAWLWQLMALCGVVGGIIFAIARWRERQRKKDWEAYQRRQVARAKAWRWLYGRARVKRLPYQRPDEQP